MNRCVLQDGVVNSLRRGKELGLPSCSPGGFKDGGTLLDPLNTPVYLSPKLITRPGTLE